MAGNVWEWVNDWSGTYQSGPQDDPIGPASGSNRVHRGGSWNYNANGLRSSNRSMGSPDYSDGTTGFRVARDMHSPQPALTSIAPTVGPATGGTPITLTGTNLMLATSVTVGGVAATSLHVVDSQTVTAITPAGAAGVCSVSVTAPGGTATLSNAFTYYEVTVPAWATLIEASPDPAVVTDDDLRGAILATGYAWRVNDTATQMEMVLIPPGTFEMGCSPSTAYECFLSESPVHAVTLTKAFYMGRYEVTQAQWQARMGSNPSMFQSASSQVPADQVHNRPVERVSWNDVQGYLAQTGMRLPTEAEWEFASRAGTTTAFHGFAGHPSGTNDDNLVGDIAWYYTNSNNQTHPVGEKLANGIGLHDMAGNVWEWVNDWSGPYQSDPQNDPTGSAIGSNRVQRGGSWNYNANGLRSSNRSMGSPDYSDGTTGFRVARDMHAPPPALTGIAPEVGPTTGGTLITLTGTNLSLATSVTVGGVAATSVQLVTPTTVTAITPAGTLGVHEVSITTSGGSATLSNAFAMRAVPSWATYVEALPDPAVVWDDTLRGAIIATGYAWRVKATATQIEMVLIPPGEFQMGCSASNAYVCYSDEHPVHTVTLTNAFYMGRYEVTQAQWQARMGSNPSYWSGADRPVERVSWNDVQPFLAQTGMRLPTEAEWEYASRAGTTTAFHGFTGHPNGTNDDNLVGNISWYHANSNGQSHPVGGKLANGYGLHDMAGNVMEWVNDWNGSYPSSPQTNPTGPASGVYRVVRGGSFYDLFTDDIRASNRNGGLPDLAHNDFVGFRVVRDP
jgi:formylglycine-generating enzyme required for sulfatase activity